MINYTGSTHEEQTNYQERIGTYVTTLLIDDMLADYNVDYYCQQTAPYTSFDLSLTITNPTTKQIAFEIKERSKNDYKFTEHSELKKDKLSRIMSATTGYDAVYYIQLLKRETAYIYDLREINFSHIPIESRYLDVSQCVSNGNKAWYDVYFIPHSLAKYTIDVKDYYRQYNNKYNKEEQQ